MTYLVLELSFELAKLKENKEKIVHNLKIIDINKNITSTKLNSIKKKYITKNSIFYNFIYELFDNDITKYIKNTNENFKIIKEYYKPEKIDIIDRDKILRYSMRNILPYDPNDKNPNKIEDSHIYSIILYFMFFYNIVDDIYENDKFEIINDEIKGHKVLDLRDLFTNTNVKSNIQEIKKSFIDKIIDKEDSFSNFMYRMGYCTVLTDINKTHTEKKLRKGGVLGKRNFFESTDHLCLPNSSLYTDIKSDNTEKGYIVKYVFQKKQGLSKNFKEEVLEKILENIVKSIKIEKEEIEKEILVKYINEDDTTNNLNICEYKENILPFAPIKFIKNKNKTEWYLKGYYSLTHENLKFNNKENINLDIKPIDESKYFQIVSYNLNNNSSLTDNIFINNCNNLNSNVFNFVCLQECNHIIKNKNIINKLKLKLSTNFRNINTNIDELIENDIFNEIIVKETKTKTRKYYLNVRYYNTSYNVIIIPDKLQEINHNIKYIAILISNNTDLDNYNAIISLLDDTKENKRRRIVLGLKDKINKRCIINVHLSTNVQFKLQYSELSYLLNKIIKKENFFRESNKKTFLNEIMIIGDFNLDAYEIADEILKSEIIRKKYKTTILFNNIITRGSLCTDDKNKETKDAGQNLDNILLLNKSTFYTDSKVAVGYNNISFKNCQSTKKDVNNISDHSPIYSCLKTSESEMQIATKTTDIKSSDNFTFKYKDLKNVKKEKLRKIIEKLLEKRKIDKETLIEILNKV